MLPMHICCYYVVETFSLTLPARRTPACERVAQILARASILARAVVAVTIFQLTRFPLPTIPAVALEVRHFVCATSVVLARIWVAFVRIWKRKTTPREYTFKC